MKQFIVCSNYLFSCIMHFKHTRIINCNNDRITDFSFIITHVTSIIMLKTRQNFMYCGSLSNNRKCITSYVQYSLFLFKWALSKCLSSNICNNVQYKNLVDFIAQSHIYILVYQIFIKLILFFLIIIMKKYNC